MTITMERNGDVTELGGFLGPKAGMVGTSSLKRLWEVGLDEVLLGGSPNKFTFAIDSISVGNTGPVNLPHHGVIAVAGGNNSGKSTLLRQMYEYLSWLNSSPQVLTPHVLTGISLHRPASAADVIAWLGAHTTFAVAPGQGGSFHRAGAGSISPTDASRHWSGVFGFDRLGPLAPFLVSHAHARERFQWVQPTNRRGNITDPSTHPLHILEQRSDLLDELNKLVADIFGSSLTLDRISGNLQLRVGTTASAAPPVDAVTEQYVRELGELKPLSEQGDGMQSVLGLLIPLVTSTHSVILIDEPEAFLHPPQARILGRALAEIATKRQVQVVVATHDRNFIVGLLEASGVELTVLRLTRDDNNTSVKQLSSADIASVWKDPVLRYTNLLDGLFHQIIVLAENDRDCSFYAAALAHLCTTNETTVKPHEILFTSTYGKHAMPRISASLRDIGVRVVVAPDLDVLNDETLMTQLVESLGGDWTNFTRDYKSATDQFRTPKPKLRNKDVKAVIAGALDENPEAEYNKETKEKVSRALYVESPWKALKEYGDRAFTKDPLSAESLLSKMDEIGIVAVRLGELERFHPGHAKGAAWLPSALQNDAHKSPEAQEQVRRMIESGGASVMAPS
ncbi:AAA family ATPase [Rhodococcus koreensis]